MKNKRIWLLSWCAASLLEQDNTLACLHGKLSQSGFINQRFQEGGPRNEFRGANHNVPGLGFGQPSQSRNLGESDAPDEKYDGHLGLLGSSAGTSTGSGRDGLRFFKQGPGDGTQQLVGGAEVVVAAQQLRGRSEGESNRCEGTLFWTTWCAMRADTGAYPE